MRVLRAAALVLFLAPVALAQYQTPTLNGSIGASEYANNSGNWYMTWDATYLYVANKAFNSTAGDLVVYLDVDPQSTPTAGSNANGTLSGVTDEGITPKLPFRADARIYAGCSGCTNSNREIRARDEAGGWSAADTSSTNISASTGLNVIEMRIRWSALPGLSGPPSSFRWIGYIIQNSSMVVDTMPPANPVGTNTSPKHRYDYTISSTADGASTSPFSVRESVWRVTSNANSGVDTLRDSITSVNADTASTRRFIVFNDINNDTITTTSDLSAITQTVTIDGTTAPDYSSTPVIVVKGFSTNTGSDHGIQLSSVSNAVIRGLVLQTHGYGIQIANGSSNTVAGNYIGTTTAGTSASANNFGISVSGCTGCTIGGTSSADRNVIAGNSNDAVYCSSSSSLTVQGNYIGVKSTGDAALANNGGISLTNCASALVGGLSSGGNVIAGNSNAGLTVTSSDDVAAYGNLIGVGSDGTTSIPNGDGNITSASSARLTVGGSTTASQNTLANGSYGLYVGSHTGGLVVGRNVMTGNSSGGVSVNGSVVQAAPTVSSAGVGNGNLTITFSLTSNSTSAATQSMRVDLYDSDATIAQPKNYRTTSVCYSGSSLTNQAWTVGGGYSVGDKLVLIATSYSDANCTTAGDGSSSNSSLITVTTLPAVTFTGPGSFSDTTKWSGGALPYSGQDFVIVNSCSYDNAVPDRTYGAMTLGDGVIPGALSWASGSEAWLQLTNIGSSTAASSIDMTNGGTLRVGGTFSTTNISFTAGVGTVDYTGSGQALAPLTYNNLTTYGEGMTCGTMTLGGGLNVVSGSLTCDNATTFSTTANAVIGGGGTITFYNLAVGGTTSANTSFAVTNSLTVTGTFTPAATVVVSGAGTLSGTGVVKVTGTASNSLASQYTLTRTLTTLTVEYAGAAAQTITTATTFSGLTVNNAAGVTATDGINVSGTLTLTSGLLTLTGSGVSLLVTNTSPSAISVGSGWVVGTISRAFAIGTNSYSFPLGFASESLPATVTVNVAASSGAIVMAVKAGDHSSAASSGIDTAKNANLYWAYNRTSGSYSSVDATLTFGSQVDAQATPATFVCRRYNNSTGVWSTTTATAGATSISITNAQGTNNSWAVGNQLLDHYTVSASSPQTAGTAFTTTVTAYDLLNAVVNDSATSVTMTSSTGNAQFDSDGNGTFGDNAKTLTSGAFTISTKDNSVESVTLTATDANNKTGASSAITVNAGPISAATSTISANPTSIPANGTSTSTITVQAKDAAGNNLTTGGAAVTLTPTSGSIGTVTDHGDGTYTATYTAGSTNGTATISGTINTVAMTNTGSVTLDPNTFTGPGSFSDATKWSFGSLPAAGTDFRIVGSCLFDAAAPVRSYGTAYFGNGSGTGTLTWQSGNSVVLDVFTLVTSVTGDTVDMTDGGTLQVRSSMTIAPTLIAGAGTIVFTGSGITISTADTFNNVTITGSATSISTFSLEGTLNVTSGASLGATSPAVFRPQNGATITGSGTIAFYRVQPASGAIVNVQTSISVSNAFFLTNATIVPAATAVISGTGSFYNPGTLRVTSTATNGFGTQYPLPVDSSATATVEFAGSAAQSVDGTTYKNLTINNPAGVTINTNATVTGTLTLTSGVVGATVGGTLTVSNSATDAVVATGGWVKTNLIRQFATGTNTYSFPVGTPGAAASCTATLTASVAGQMLVSSSAGDHGLAATSGIDVTRSANVKWTAYTVSGTASSVDLTFNFGALVDGTATPTSFVLRRLRNSDGVWFDTSATPGATAISATGLPVATTLNPHEYAAGNQVLDHYAVSAPSPQSAGTPFNATVTAKDLLDVTVSDASTLVTMTSSTGHAQFDGDGNGTFGDNTKTLTNGTGTISTKDNTVESLTLTATDANGKTGTSSSITVNIGPASGSTTTITASPTSIVANGTATSTITVQAKDAGGNNLASSGGAVTLATTLGSVGVVTNNNNGTYTATLTAGTQSGTATISGTINGSPITAGTAVTLIASFGPPPSFTATAASTSSVLLTWGAVDGATSFEIYRATSVSGGFAPLVMTAGPTYTDNGLTANTSYLYKIRTIGGSGPSAFTSIDAATTTVFTDATLNSSITAKTAHITQLRTAVNAMRAAANLSAASFTDSTLTAQSTQIQRIHITELRTALDAARTAIGLSTITYTDPTITTQSTTIKAAHLTELRAGTQ